MPINPQIPTPPVAEWRNGLDIDQILVGKLSGGANSDQIVTTDATAKTAGNVAAWDEFGRVVNGGIAVTETVSALTVNGPPTVLVNGDPVSWDDVILVNGTNSQILVNGD